MTQLPSDVRDVAGLKRELEVRWHDAAGEVCLVWGTEDEALARRLLSRGPSWASRGELVERHTWSTPWRLIATTGE